MDEARSTGRKERPEASGRRPVDPAREAEPHDPVTGTRAGHPPPRQRTRPRSQTPDEIAHDIRQTRAEMSETVGEIERRLAPERLKHKMKDSVQDTIDEVRHRYSPQNMANKAGKNMMDTMRDHPLPALAAGLSIGYLLMKSGERSHHRGYDDRGRAYYGRGTYPESTAGRTAAPTQTYRETRLTGYAEPYGPDESSEGRPVQDGTSEKVKQVQQQASEKVGQAQQSAREKVDEVRERTGEMAHQAQHHAQQMGRRAEHQARRAQSGMERFVRERPLAAGAIAAGVGALLGELLPATQTENEWMGRTRDQTVHRAKHVAKQTMEHGKEAAGHVADKAVAEAQHLAEEAKNAGREVKREAQTEAKHVKEKAREEAKSGGQ